MSVESDPFRSNLSLGLHAAAQPLAILRSWFDPLYNADMSGDDLRHMVDTSAEHIDRLCTLFGYLQQLVAAESLEPKLWPVEVHPFVADVVDGIELWFQTSGISLFADVSATCGLALIDSSKMQQVLSTVLMVAHGLSARGDQVELSAKPSTESIKITIRNSNSTAETLSSEGALGFAAAEAATRRQNGNFTYTLNPLVVSINIPKANTTN